MCGALIWRWPWHLILLFQCIYLMTKITFLVFPVGGNFWVLTIYEVLLEEIAVLKIKVRPVQGRDVCWPWIIIACSGVWSRGVLSVVGSGRRSGKADHQDGHSSIHCQQARPQPRHADWSVVLPVFLRDYSLWVQSLHRVCNVCKPDAVEVFGVGTLEAWTCL